MWMTQMRFWRWVILGGVAILLLVLPFPASARPVERTFRIQASQFEYSPSVLVVNPGDRVTIELTAADVVHGLSIDGYKLSTTAEPGHTAHLTFIADREGAYRIRCTATCGNLHPFMIGKLHVGYNELLWRGTGLSVLALIAAVWKVYR